jgi:hypothetical protein
MTRRSLTRVLLSLLLLISQQMAMSHVVSHWAGSRGAAAQLHQERKDGALSKAFAQDQTCEQCLAFAQFANAIGNTPRWFAAEAVGSSVVAVRATGADCVRTICVFQPRAPPAAA